MTDRQTLLSLAERILGPLALKDCAKCGSDDITPEYPKGDGRWSIRCLDCGHTCSGSTWTTTCLRWGIKIVRARAAHLKDQEQ